MGNIKTKSRDLVKKRNAEIYWTGHDDEYLFIDYDRKLAYLFTVSGEIELNLNSSSDKIHQQFRKEWGFFDYPPKMVQSIHKGGSK